ncbi:hypothetical protein GOHSU_14_01210 [Gordonia hirsuta DSM 44140 = NBRC 16056]|uniref:Uncharacterized protein n=1 Tax=Gordonia hirsuta DSM 44140 = NBRC 16056 TaxID=1121927 RepID=L7L7S3_9ACTN|nr:hypothetical protein [Gordonia hirsuta]GAC56954.1 hypothetical protein GOHSU_14_01210 [Gordonia hirsuta DSM 44140 = NBRC 16056]
MSATSRSSPARPRPAVILLVAMLAAAGLIGGAWGTWTQQDYRVSAAGTTPVAAHVDVTGLGEVAVHWPRPDSNTPEGAAILELWTDAASVTIERELSPAASDTGLWTLAFGVVVAAGAVATVFSRRYGGLAMIAAGLMSTVTAAVAVADPGRMLDDTGSGLDLFPDSTASVGAGLWLTLAGAVLALVVGAVTLLTSFPVRTASTGTPHRR